jgi:hypothetical protein
MAWWTRSGFRHRAGWWTRSEAKEALRHGRGNRERAALAADQDNDQDDDEHDDEQGDDVHAL